MIGVGSVRMSGLLESLLLLNASTFFQNLSDSDFSITKQQQSHATAASLGSFCSNSSAF